MKVLLIRHGLTDQNVIDKNGNAGNDYPLNSLGIEQVKDVSKNINIMKPNIIYSSPKIRALQTATIIGEICGISNINTTNLLLEYDMGEWEYLSSNDLHKHIDSDKNWDKGRPSFDWSPPGGESWKDMQVRAKKFLNKLKAKNQESDVVVVVSHNQFIRALRGVALNLDFKLWFEYKPNNAEIFELDL